MQVVNKIDKVTVKNSSELQKCVFNAGSPNNSRLLTSEQEEMIKNQPSLECDVVELYTE